MEIRTSVYNDPDQKTGQHTNGIANIFVREDDSSPWYLVNGIAHTHKVRKLINELSLHVFIRRHCSKVGD